MVFQNANISNWPLFSATVQTKTSIQLRSFVFVFVFFPPEYTIFSPHISAISELCLLAFIFLVEKISIHFLPIYLCLGPNALLETDFSEAFWITPAWDLLELFLHFKFLYHKFPHYYICRDLFIGCFIHVCRTPTTRLCNHLSVQRGCLCVFSAFGTGEKDLLCATFCNLWGTDEMFFRMS